LIRVVLVFVVAWGRPGLRSRLIVIIFFRDTGNWIWSRKYLLEILLRIVEAGGAPAHWSAGQQRRSPRAASSAQTRRTRPCTACRPSTRSLTPSRCLCMRRFTNWESSLDGARPFRRLHRYSCCAVSAFHKGQSVLHVARRLLRAVSRAVRNLWGSTRQPELVICGFLRPPRRFSDHDRRPRGTVSCVDRADRVRPG
jgi:hypothetical protein